MHKGRNSLLPVLGIQGEIRCWHTRCAAMGLCHGGLLRVLDSWKTHESSGLEPSFGDKPTAAGPAVQEFSAATLPLLTGFSGENGTDKGRNSLDITATSRRMPLCNAPFAVAVSPDDTP